MVTELNHLARPTSKLGPHPSSTHMMMFIHALLAAQLAASTIVLPDSTSGSVRVLHVDSKPVARSYDGLDWERTQGGATLDIDCSGGACQADISTNSVYNITSHEVPRTITSLQKASRFLVQATFGPTRATLESVDATTGAGFTKWIEDQMALPPTLHREYYRRRANPRLFTARNAGGVRAPCQAGSRWHLFSFNRADEGKKLRVNKAVLRIEGEHVRTENAGVDPRAFDNMIICVVEERVGGAIHLRSNLEDCTDNSKLDKAKILKNPQVTFSLAAGHAAKRTLNASKGALIQISGVRNASILQNDLKCNDDLKRCNNDLECKHDLFLFDGSTYWRHDPRLQLLSNTIEELYDDSVSTGVPFVAKTFLNEHTCMAKPNANLWQATQWPAETDHVHTRVYEVCGSPGEVANAPSESNRYNIILTHKRAAPGDSYPMDMPTIVADETDDLFNINDLHSFNRDRTGGGAGSSQGRERGTGSLGAGKNVVWSTVVLRAEDQLRQRVAWALSQIFVISDAAGRGPYSEPWHAYYDIFVRHAFGNYRDVMREVAYSPMMGEYLSFSGNKAMSFDGSYPDENFAREIMQLFSIGLYKLNSDGALPRAVHTAPSIYGTYTVQRTLHMHAPCIHGMCMCRHAIPKQSWRGCEYLHQRRCANICESVDWSREAGALVISLIGLAVLHTL